MYKYDPINYRLSFLVTNKIGFYGYLMIINKFKLIYMWYIALIRLIGE